MKRFILALFGASLLAVAGIGWYIKAPKAPAAPRPEAAEPATTPANDEQQPIEPLVAAQPDQAAKRLVNPALQSTSRLANPAPAPSTAVNPVLDASFLSRTLDVLVSPQTTHEQKQGAWKQLRDAGKLDQAIAELEQRTADNPRSAEYPAALGQAYLQKCGTIKDLREQGILAMQADKVFDTALSLDPVNWEARFTKAVAMSYWPPMLNKGEEVVQHFQTLIQQQEAQAPQPQFAATYAWLGDQYQKSGRNDDARAVWQRGAALFPADDKLRSKLSSTPAAQSKPGSRSRGFGYAAFDGKQSEARWPGRD